MLNNRRNIERRMTGRRSIFTDDCGIWSTKSSSTKESLFIQGEGGKLEYLLSRGGQYGRFVKKEWKPFDDQPNEEDILVVKRYYGTLKRQPIYRKRITWFQKVPKTMPLECTFRAVAEFTGKFPPTISVHGNAKKTKKDYVKSSQTTMHLMGELVKTLPPKQVFASLNQLDYGGDAPRNLRQVQNKGYHDRRKKRGIHLPIKPKVEEVEYNPEEVNVADVADAPGMVSTIQVDHGAYFEAAPAEGETATYYIIHTEEDGTQQLAQVTNQAVE